MTPACRPTPSSTRSGWTRSCPPTRSDPFATGAGIPTPPPPAAAFLCPHPAQRRLGRLVRRRRRDERLLAQVGKLPAREKQPPHPCVREHHDHGEHEENRRDRG